MLERAGVTTKATLHGHIAEEQIISMHVFSHIYSPSEITAFQ